MTQLTIFDIETSFLDETVDRFGKKYKKVPDFYRYERCENCSRWVRYPVDEQPPSGWGVYGFCNEHKQRVEKIGYCNSWEDKRRL